MIAINIPEIPNKFPCLEVSGDESPRRAKINNIPEVKYKNAARFGDISFLYFFFFFLYICNILCVTKKPPKILIAASNMAKKPKIFEISKLELFSPAKDAIIAPTIITEEMAFVTDINGVCKDGVTLQTT
jgi:hypothetical protein